MELNINLLQNLCSIKDVFEELKKQVGWKLKIKIEKFNNNDVQYRRIILHSRSFNKLSKKYNGTVLVHDSTNGTVSTLCPAIPKYLEVKKIKNYKEDDYEIYPITDGTTCNLYHFGGKWCISTSSHYDATNYTWLGTKSMMENLKDCIDVSEFNGGNVYTIHFSHPDCHFYREVKQPVATVIAVNGKPLKRPNCGQVSELGAIYQSDERFIIQSPKMLMLRRLVYSIPKNLRIQKEDRIKYIALRAILMNHEEELIEIAPKFKLECDTLLKKLNLLSDEIYATMRNSKERKKLLGHKNDKENGTKKLAGIIINQILEDNGKPLVAGKNSVFIIKNYVYDIDKIKTLLQNL